MSSRAAGRARPIITFIVCTTPPCSALLPIQKQGLRLATIFGSICAVVSMLIAMVYLVMKLIWWDRFPAGMAPMLIGMLFLGSVQLFFIGFLGEYIMSINQRVMKRPLVIEEERINFNEEEKKGGNEA